MRKLRVGRSIWLPSDSPSRPSTFPALQARQHTDIVIVGGGITGATLAVEFLRAGFRVAVLEQHLIGRGSTAASTALLLRRPDTGANALIQRYGRRDGVRMWRMSERAALDFVAMLRDLAIDCDLSARDSIYYAPDAAGAATLRAEFECRRRLGADDEWLDARALERASGIRGAAAIRTAGDAQCDPFAACVGLMQWAAQEGVAVFERTRVRRIRRTSDGVEVVTPGGRISAAHVVIATGYATPQFKPLVARFRMSHTYVLATAPLSARQRGAINLRDLMLWDTERPYHYARWTSDRRLLMGGSDRDVVPDAQRAKAFRGGTRALKAHFEGVLPALATLDIDCAWEGLFAATPDSLPFIGPHRRYPRHLFALGYGGNGMTFASLAARLLTAHVKGRPAREARLFSFARTRRDRRAQG